MPTDSNYSNPVDKWSPQSTKLHPLSLTPAALLHLQKQIAKRGYGIGMRLSIKKTGCSGYGYVVELIDATDEDDHVFNLDSSLILAVNAKSYPYLKGTVIDFIKKGFNTCFKYNNPNEKSICGCGESFKVDDEAPLR